MERYHLTILPVGLITTKIRIINPDNSLEIICDALIDTGAEVSLMCNSVFEKLLFIPDKIFEGGTSTLDGNELVKVVSVRLHLPNNNWSPIDSCFYVKDLAIRDEYEAIIGMDILAKFQFIYNGFQKVAILDAL